MNGLFFWKCCETSHDVTRVPLLGKLFRDALDVAAVIAVSVIYNFVEVVAFTSY